MNLTSATSFGFTQVVTASSFTRAGKGDFTRLERQQLAVQFFKGRVAETGADMADIAPCSSRRGPPAPAPRNTGGSAGRGEAGDHDLLSPRRLDLEPVGGPRTRQVGALGSLGHDAFEARFSASRKNLVPNSVRCWLKASNGWRGKTLRSRFLRSRSAMSRKSSPPQNIRSKMQ